jgi:hypothetical protein
LCGVANGRAHTISPRALVFVVARRQMTWVLGVRDAAKSRPIVRANSSVAASFLPRITSALTRTWVLVLLWLVVLAYAVRFAIFKLPAPPQFTDFNHFYVAALAVRMGSNPYITNLDTLSTLGLQLSVARIENQPPTLQLCFEPLTRLDPYTAYWIWVEICLASLVIALYLLLERNLA